MATKTTKESTATKSGANGKKKRSSVVSSPSATYFLSITLQNIRCFGEEPQTLDLSDGEGRPAQWTVLLGNNGTGKTTILQCLSAFENVPIRGKGDPEETHFDLPRMFLNFMSGKSDNLINVKSRGTARLIMRVANGDALIGFGGIYEEHEITAIFSFGGRGEFRGTPASPTVYGFGAGRQPAAASIAREGMEDGAANLFNSNAQLRNAEEWLLGLDYSASKPSKIQQTQKGRLSQAKRILIDILPDVLDIRFTTPTEKRPRPRIEFETHYGWVPLGQLGHGYQTLIAWMVDFASRMVDRYPDSKNPLAEPAVVLVDEIDLHLHPTWQRKVMSHLTTLFPNTQFIVTAHSPLIVQAAANANIALLRREGDHVVIDNDVENIRGWRIDQILTSDLYGLETARPPDMEEDLKRRKKLLTKNRLTKAEKKEVEELEKKIGFLPGGETGKEASKMIDLLEKSNRLLEKYQSK